MDKKQLEAEVLSELNKMESEVSKQEPEVVEQIEESEGNAEAPIKENASLSQDVGKSDGKKSGVQARIDKLTRSVKEAQERAEKLEAELKAEREAKNAKKEEDSDEQIDLEPSHKAYLAKVIKEEAEKILAERDKRAEELAFKQQQEAIIQKFKETVLKDYADSYDETNQSFNDDATEQILSLTELISTNPSFYMPKLEQFGAKKMYNRFIADEDVVVQTKKKMPHTISSQSKPISQPLNPKASNADYKAQMIKEILAELE